MANQFFKSSIIFLFCIISSYLLAEQFIVKKKTKTPSTGKLKEMCCEQFADLLHQIPAIMHLLADVQTTSYGAISGYCEGVKTSFCESASKEQLKQTAQTLTELNQLFSDFIKKTNTKIQKVTDISIA